MEKIFSNIKENSLLHMVKRKKDILLERENLCTDEQYLQCSTMYLNKGKTFKPHKHFHRSIYHAMFKRPELVEIGDHVEVVILLQIKL
jgi:hypothetical protein